MTAPRQSNDSSQTSAILLWVGIAVGLVFIVAVVFFSGFFIGRHSGFYDRDRDGGMYPGMMWPQRTGPGMMSPPPSASTFPSPTR